MSDPCQLSFSNQKSELNPYPLYIVPSCSSNGSIHTCGHSPLLGAPYKAPQSSNSEYLLVDDDSFDYGVKPFAYTNIHKFEEYRKCLTKRKEDDLSSTIDRGLGVGIAVLYIPFMAWLCLSR